MKPHVCIHFILLVGFTIFCTACQRSNLAGDTLPAEQQNRLTVAQSTPPLPVVIDRLDAITAYQVTVRRAMRQTQPDGFILPSAMEYTYAWSQTGDAYGYNVHTMTTLTDPLSGESAVMDEGYLVGDLAFLYCPVCPLPADQAGWSVSKRHESAIREFTLDIDGVSRIMGTPLAMLMTQSLVIGDETINDVSVTHYRLTDIQALSDAVRTMIGGGASATPLEVSLAALDIWLTVGDQQPIQYTLQVEGKNEYIAGSQELLPFTIQEQYQVAAINHQMTITVPATVLDAVAAPLKALAGN